MDIEQRVEEERERALGYLEATDLREVRERLGRSQAAAARAADVQQSVVSRVERKQTHGIGSLALIRIAETYRAMEAEYGASLQGVRVDS